MGQKVSPIGMRIGIIRDWESRWFADKEYGDLLLEDIKIRKFINETYKKENLISRIEIERSKNKINLIIRTARPGNFIGSDGKTLEGIKKKLVRLTSGKEININIIEVGNPELDARLVAMKIAKLLEERQSFRTAQKKAIQQTMRSGAKGIKTIVSGRLGGADIARSEGYSEGVVPLHTLRSDIDFAWEEAMTTYGKLGVKVWICRGEVLPGEMVHEPEKPKTMGNPRSNSRRRNDRRPRNEQVVASNDIKIENKVIEEKQEDIKETMNMEEVKDGE